MMTDTQEQVTKKIKTGAALSKDDYPRVAEKVKNLNVPNYWCEARGECACRGCANRLITWAEYECWKKYSPEFNKTRSD